MTPDTSSNAPQTSPVSVSPGQAAREALDGHWGFALTCSGAIIAAYVFCGFLTAPLTRNNRPEAALMQFLIGLILHLIVSLLVDGAFYALLLRLRGNKDDPMLLLRPFSDQPDRYLIAALVKTAAGLLAFLPLLLLELIPSSPEIGTAGVIILLLAGFALNVFFQLSLFPAVFLLLDGRSADALPAVTESIALMKGRRIALLKLLLPFLLYALLSVITVGMAFLWVLPYRMTVLAAFYDQEIAVLYEEEQADPA